MTKQEVQARVLKNGKPLDLDLFTWDESTKTFSSEEHGLVLDFRGIDWVTFKTGYDCTFDTGYDCTFYTSRRSTFNTSRRCTFKTGYACTFKTGETFFSPQSRNSCLFQEEIIIDVQSGHFLAFGFG